MTVYVDDLRFTRAGVKKARVKYCHMVADSLEELHAFAKQIKVEPHFFHRARSCHHYDIVEHQKLAALVLGAVSVRSREIVRIGKEMK